MSLDEALAKPTPDAVIPGPRRAPTAEVVGHRAEITVDSHRASPDGDGADVLRQRGLDPADWEAIGFRTSTWDMANGEQGHSERWSFERTRGDHTVPIDDLIAAISHRPAVVAHEPTPGDWGYVVALGDMQFGKIDGDGAAGTLARALDCLERARTKFDEYDERYPIGHVHIAWLGDHCEGFQSQGGANVWRTPLTLSEQIRLTRRVMLHAVQLWADAGVPRVTVAAVPGNHGETTRFAGKGVTRYDDSHDTEALIAVADACALDPNRYGHVRFLVPDTDELTVTVDVAGTLVGHAHGHQWRTGQHMRWWSGQAFGESPLRDARLLLAGHLHHFHAEADSGRLFVQVPALEHSSVWWRHQTGTGGDPGLVVALTRDGITPVFEIVRPTP